MYTKDTENGYSWLSLQNSIPYSNPKHDFLSGMLERYNILRIAQNKDYLIDCRDALTRLQSEGKTEEISIDIVVNNINKFYTDQSNLPIPIINAYCYCIKEMAGESKTELNEYLRKLLETFSD